MRHKWLLVFALLIGLLGGALFIGSTAQVAAYPTCDSRPHTTCETSVPPTGTIVWPTPTPCVHHCNETPRPITPTPCDHHCTPTPTPTVTPTVNPNPPLPTLPPRFTPTPVTAPAP